MSHFKKLTSLILGAVIITSVLGAHIVSAAPNEEYPPNQIQQAPDNPPPVPEKKHNKKKHHNQQPPAPVPDNQQF